MPSRNNRPPLHLFPLSSTVKASQRTPAHFCLRASVRPHTVTFLMTTLAASVHWGLRCNVPSSESSSCFLVSLHPPCTACFHFPHRDVLISLHFLVHLLLKWAVPAGTWTPPGQVGDGAYTHQHTERAETPQSETSHCLHELIRTDGNTCPREHH